MTEPPSRVPKRGYLDEIASPSDLKAMPASRLQRLAEEIRSTIIETVAANGGHLAPNLGVVELAIALHRVFSSPEDRIIWDVGHQSYAHKLLTGRAGRFETLRREGGISGFPRRAESEHDVFETGHASTSLSAALGLAAARDLRGESHAVVAVIGDGALTGGMAFEALNNAGDMKRDLIVVLNDNELSYGPTVGGMASYLARMRAHPAYYRAKHDLEGLVKRVPLVGPALYHWGGRLKGSVKYLVVPGMLFEELGLTYLGPIDGHNLSLLEEVLRRARRIRGPSFVHVLTKKGRGYAPAEADPDRFHGTGPFEISTGKALPVERRSVNGPSTSINGHHPEGASYTEVFGRALLSLGSRDERVVAITAAMASSTGVRRFAEAYPKRWFDVGISEQHAVTFAAGLATGGFRPVVAIYSTFLQRAYDQILHDVCLQNLPVIFAVDRAGLVGADGPTHHGAYDLSYLRAMPGMVIMAPKDEQDLGRMLATALALNGPAAIRYPRGHGPGTPLDAEPEALPVGRGAVLREGRDAAILAVGSMVEPALGAAERLSGRGYDVTVASAAFVAPLDRELILRLVETTGGLVTVEENVGRGGFGSAVTELLVAEGRFPGPDGCRLRCLALPDQPVEHGRAETLLARFDLDPEGIARAVLRILPR